MKPYLLIPLSDFRYTLLGKSPEEKFRSLEKYLEKHAIPFDCEGSEMTIFAKDEFEARMIGTHLRLKRLQYFVNGKLTELSLEKAKPMRQPRAKMADKNDPDEVTNLKSLKQIIYAEKKEDAIPLTVLMKKRILTQEEYKKGVKDGTFHPVVFGHKKHISKAEIQAFLTR